MGSLFSRAARVFVAVGCASGLVGVSHAYDPGDVRSEFVANRTISTASHASQAWSAANGAGGGATIGRNFVMAAPGGRTVANSVSAALTAKQVLSIGARALPLVGAAAVLWEVFDEARVWRDQVEAGGSLRYNPGVPPTNSGMWCADNIAGDLGVLGTVCSASLGQLANDVANRHAVYLEWNYRYSGQYPNPEPGCCKYTDARATVTVQNTRLIDPHPYNTFASDFRIVTRPANSVIMNYGSPRAGQQRNVIACAAYVDPIDPRYSRPEGTMPDADGKCAGGPTEAITEDAAADKAVPLVGTYSPSELLAEALGVAPQPIPAGLVEVGNTVPKVDGPVTTTTTVEGGDTRVKTEAIGWNFARDPLRKNEGTWSTVKQTEVRDSAGNLISAETTGEAGKTEDEAKAEAGDQCALHPDTVGCMGIGSVPTDQVPTASRNLDFSSIAVGGASGCPAPVNIAGHGMFDFEPLCDGLTTTRPLIIALGFLAAAGIVVGALRT